jgi:hypothetical protein
LRCAVALPGYFGTGDGLLISLANLAVAVRRWPETVIYQTAFGRIPNYLRPRTYTEKIQWRKLFDRDPRLVTFCDKLAERRIAEETAPDIAVPELLWSGGDPDAIPFDRLEPPYIVKPNNRSGEYLIVRTARDIDEDHIRSMCSDWIGARPHRRRVYEWGYRGVEPKLLIEAFQSRPLNHNPPPELKVFVFADRAQFVYYGDPFDKKWAVHDRNWVRYEFDRWKRVTGPGRKPLDAVIERPPGLEAALSAAEKIAAGMDHLRVDFFDLGDEVCFNETAVYPWSGNKMFIGRDDPADPHPSDEVDLEIGSWWDPGQMPVGKMLKRGLFG